MCLYVPYILCVSGVDCPTIMSRLYILSSSSLNVHCICYVLAAPIYDDVIGFTLIFVLDIISNCMLPASIYLTLNNYFNNLSPL